MQTEPGNGGGPLLRPFLFSFGVIVPGNPQQIMSAVVQLAEPPKAAGLQAIATTFAQQLRAQGRDPKSGAVVIGQPPVQVSVLAFQELVG